MTIQEINQAYHRIIGALDVKALKEAFDQIQCLIAGIRDYTFMDRLNELQDTYRYMLRYRLEGARDPMEEQIHQQLLANTYQLAEQVHNKALSVDSPLIYYSYRRSLGKQALPSYAQLHHELHEMALCQAEVEERIEKANQRMEAATLQLFNKIWIADALTTEEIVAIQTILRDETLPTCVSCQVVSALLLALQASFDIAKLLLLFDAAEANNEPARYRAVVCILLILSLYRKRIAVYPEIDSRLAALADLLPEFVPLLRFITLRFILARETEKISQKLQNEIIPEMMKLSPNMSQKINLKEITPESLSEEVNPKWQELLSNSRIEKHMKEFSEMQMEGADMLHSTFIHLKHYPFFREVGNWFLPFSTHHSSIAKLFKGDSMQAQLLQGFINNPLICSSDRYSFVFSMSQISQQFQELLHQRIDDDMLKMMKSQPDEWNDPRKRREKEISLYIQDLYRFFKLHPAHLDLEDPFQLRLDFHNQPILQPYMDDQETLSAISEYYLRKNYFEEALIGFDRLSEGNEEESMLFQKKGYCKQMLGRIEEALQDYLHADLIHSDKWLTRHIASCYRTLKQPEKALPYYRRLETQQPDDMALLINIGHCYLEQKNYSEALKYFYKVDYLDSQSTKAWRPIAWCSFLIGKYDQARNYYRKILDNKPTTQDYLNAGHTEWVLQQLKSAVNHYTAAVRREQGNFQSFQEAFEQDIPDLLQAGVEEEEIPLMLDQVRYSLED